PRDRDQAFARLDGVLVWVAGFYQPQLIGFGEDYPSIWRITYSGRVVDRRLLVDLERSVWDSTARALQARLTDSVIDAAVRRLPTAYYRQSGLGLVRALQRRRDRLPEMAGRFYAPLAPPRDWGSLWLPLAWVSYAPDIGLFVGGGMTRTRYGFRRLPYRSQVQVRAGYATDAQTYRAELRAEFPGLLAPASVSLRARASGLDVIRFYGFGNETVDTGSLAFHKVKQQQYLVAPALEL